MEEKFDKPEEMQQEMNNPFETDANENIAPLLKRVSLFLEDKDWVKADEYCERVLDQDPENATAYLGKLMSEMKVSKLEELADSTQSFENNGNYKKVKRFGDDKIGQLLDGYLETIRERAKDVQMVDTSSNDLPEAESRPKPWEKLTKKENGSKGSIFKKKGLLIGLIAAVVIIAAVIIIVSTTSPVDSKLVGLWLATDEVSGHSSAIKIERNGKCSGMTKTLFGDVMLFRGECSTKKGTMGIEVREITSTYVNEEEVLSNDTAIGFLLVEYEFKNPALYFTKVKDSGKGYFANYVLCPKYKTENKIFFKTNNPQDRKAFNEVISSWFERDTTEEQITENRQTEIESYNPNVPVENLPKEEDTTTKTSDESKILYSTVDELMFRSGPGTEYQAIAKINRGSWITVIEIKDGWVHGNYGGLDGWAFGEYLTEGGPTDTKFSIYVEAIKNFDIFPGMISAGVGCDPQYLSEDDEYAYYKVLYGGGWAFVKVPKNTQNHIPEYMTDDEIAKHSDKSTQEEVVLAWVCEYTQMTAEQFYEAGGHIDYQTSGTLYDYYIVAVPMAAATIVEITKTPPYTIDRTGPSYAFTGPGGWGYR